MSKECWKRLLSVFVPDFLNKVAHLEAREQAEADYDIPRGLKFVVLPT